MYFQLSVGEMIPLAPRMCQTFPQHAPCMCLYVPSMNSARSRLLPACSPPAPFCFLSCPQHVPRMFTYVPSAPTMLPPCSHHATAMFPPCSLNPRRLFVNQIVQSQRRGAIWSLDNGITNNMTMTLLFLRQHGLAGSLGTGDTKNPKTTL